MADIYEYDILNRNPGYTLNKTTADDRVIYELRDDSNVFVSCAKSMIGDDHSALGKIRVNMGVGAQDLPLLSTTERNGISPHDGLMIINITTNQIETYHHDSWSSHS